jgi:Rps23 Pro-64 3,4-dihydroxylase Tpa1-like proline 4-hydroxylase
MGKGLWPEGDKVMSNIEFEVLDLGLVLYHKMIPNAGKVIVLANSLAERFVAGEHGDSYTRIKDWEPWWDDHMPKPFNHKFYVYRHRDISDNDYYRKELIEIADSLYGSLDTALEHYFTLYPWARASVKGEEQLDGILRYDEDGGHLPAHQDLGVSSRLISTVSYLNDDYDGGEIEFRQSNVVIKPVVGDIVFFPSNYLYVHEVMATQNGTRYSMPHWFHSQKEIQESTGEE